VAGVPARSVPLTEPKLFKGGDAELAAATIGDCAYLPLRRPEPYSSLQLALITDVILTLNQSVLPQLQAARAATGASALSSGAMPWAGTLLGAYRGRDIIPWTNDGDVLIPSQLVHVLRAAPSVAGKHGKNLCAQQGEGRTAARR
jgi:hypothetical protein